MHIPGSDATVRDLSRRCIATTGGVCLRTLVDRKRKCFINAVDVVKRLCNATDPSTECTAAPCSTHVHLDDVPRALDPVEDDREFHQHDGVATVMMKLPAQGFA